MTTALYILAAAVAFLAIRGMIRFLRMAGELGPYSRREEH